MAAIDPISILSSTPAVPPSAEVDPTQSAEAVHAPAAMPTDELCAAAAAADPAAIPAIAAERLEMILAIREALATDTYETPERIDGTVDAILTLGILD